MYDLIVIGAGWAGFSAAEYASRKGLKVALVEKDSLGGTCLNRGCIPTKTLLNTAKLISQFKKSAKFGIDATFQSVDLARLNQRKDEVVSRLKSGIDFLLKSSRVELISGAAYIEEPDKVRVNGDTLEAKNILIATGSRPMELPGIKFDGKKVLSSTESLDIREVPGKILIIGGGVIGCEFAEIFVSLGSQVEVVELTPCLLPGIDSEAAKKLESALKKKGVNISLNMDAAKLNFGVYDKVLLCIGRIPDSECFGDIDIKRERSRILVDEYLKTSVPGIYAAGDCIGGYLLAHVASYEGRLAVKNIIGKDSEKADYRAVPSAIFTNPEIASVGLNEEEARKTCQDVTIKKIDFRSLGMSYIIDETDGFIKVIADSQEYIVGAVIIGPKATELIHVLALAITNRMKLSQVSNTIFAHPTLSEGILEALLH